MVCPSDGLSSASSLNEDVKLSGIVDKTPMSGARLCLVYYLFYCHLYIFGQAVFSAVIHILGLRIPTGE